MVKCEVSSWGVAPAPRYSDGFITFSWTEKSAHSGLPEGTGLNRIGRSDLSPVFIKIMNLSWIPIRFLTS